MNISKGGQFRYAGKEVGLEAKKRIVVGSIVAEPVEGVRYRVFKNDLGQILLDPVKSVSAYEAWIYENPDRIASIKRGIQQAEARKVVRVDPRKGK